jgi:hypothetical protein
LVAIGGAVEERERELAKERQGRRTDLVESFHDVESGKVRDKIAAPLGISGRTYEKAKAVVEAANDNEKFAPLVEDMDRTGKVNGAFKKLRQLQGEGTTTLRQTQSPVYSDAHLKHKAKPDLDVFAEKLATKITNIFSGQLGEQIRAVVNEREYLSAKRCAALEVALIEVSICTHGWSEQLAGDAAGAAVELSTAAAWHADKMKWATERKELQREIKLHKRTAKAYLTSIRDTERANRICVDDLYQDLNKLRSERDTLRYELDHPGDRAVAQAAAARAETVSTSN